MIGRTRKRFSKLAYLVGTGALGVVAACGGGGGGTPSGTPGNPFDPANFSPPWLDANINATGSPVNGGTLTVVGTIDVSAALDTGGEYETIGANAERVFARQLLTYPASKSLATAESLVPDAATALPTISSDGLTYTFTLRSGVMWNTQTPRAVTSKDYVIGLKRLCDPTLAPNGNPGYYVATIAGYGDFCTPFMNMDPGISAAARATYINSHDITGVTTPDSSTIVFKLTAPASDFVNLIAEPFVSAVPVEELQFVPLTVGNPIFSDGPFQVVGCNTTNTAANFNNCTGYDPGHSITFEHNPAWSQSTDPNRHNYVDKIVIKEDLADESAVQQQIAAGTADVQWNTTVPTSNLASLESPTWNPQFGSYPAPGTTNPYLVFNVQSPNNNGALGNPAVRQALEYALDKTAIGKIYGGPDFNQPLDQVIGPGAQGYVPFNLYPTPGHKGDPDKCKSMLAAAGVTNLTLKDYYRDNGKHPAIYQEVLTDFGKCGVTVVGTKIHSGYYGSKGIGVKTKNDLKLGNWDITEPGWIPDWFGPANGRAILPDLFDGALNFPGTDWGGYDNPAVDSLINQALAAPSLSQASDLWHQADMKVMQDAAFIPFQAQLTPLFRSAHVHGAYAIPFTEAYDWTQIWLA
jgi:ABC-type transport system substrate-binding protein